jgi:hypothetical protein
MIFPLSLLLHAPGKCNYKNHSRGKLRFNYENSNIRNIILKINSLPELSGNTSPKDGERQRQKLIPASLRFLKGLPGKKSGRMNNCDYFSFCFCVNYKCECVNSTCNNFEVMPLTASGSSINDTIICNCLASDGSKH